MKALATLKFREMCIERSENVLLETEFSNLISVFRAIFVNSTVEVWLNLLKMLFSPRAIMIKFILPAYLQLYYRKLGKSL